MSTLAETFNRNGKAWWIALAGATGLIIVAMTLPNLNRSRLDAVQSHETGASNQVAERFQPLAFTDKIAGGSPPASKSLPVEAYLQSPVDAAGDRKIVRNASADLVVQKPAETMEAIRGLAESAGGFLVTSNVSGGQNASSGSVTIRVPSARFHEVWDEIRKLGVRAEAEHIEAQDVTRQYVDQDASLRNLRAEEAQYLAILKQAGSVKDMLAVTEKLSEVRGQIEQQQAEFDALSKQVETVTIAITLRTEAESRAFGLHWRPLYQIKLALRDGLEAVAVYAAAIVSILFYLPAVLLWTGTVLVFAVTGWKGWQLFNRMFTAWTKRGDVRSS